MSSTAIEVDPDTLGTLISFLGSFYVSGKSEFSRDEWYADGEPRSVHIEDAQSDGRTVCRAINALYRMRRLQALLFLLTVSITDERELLQINTESAILHYGISSLPNEILANVLEMAINMHTRRQEGLVYTLVCRRFRDAILNNPGLCLWTEIESTRRQEWIDLQIARSGGCPLYLRVSRHLRDVDRGSPSFWSSVTSHHRRWKHLVITGSSAYAYHDLIQGGEGAPETDIPPNLDLQNLTRLVVYDAKANRDLNNSYLHPCASWRMPKNRDLIVDEVLFAIALPNSLLSLAFTASNHYMTKPALLMDILRTDVAKNLVDLELLFHSEVSTTRDGNAVETFIYFDRLRKFTFSIDGAVVTGKRIINKVLNLLRMPNVRTIAAVLNIEGHSDLHDYFVGWLRGQDLEHLRSLRVKVKECRSDEAVDLEDSIYSDLTEWMENKWEAHRQPRLRVKVEPKENEELDDEYYGEI